MAVRLERPSLRPSGLQPVWGLLAAILMAGGPLLATAGCGDSQPAGDGGPADGAPPGDLTPDSGGQPDSGPGADGTGTAGFIGVIRVEQLAGGEPSFPVSFVAADDAATVPTTARGGCQIGCIGEYPDDPGITCGESRLTPPLKLSNGPIVLDIDDDGDGSPDRSYNYDFVGNDYSPAKHPPTPFFGEGASLRVTSNGDPNAVPDAVQAEVPGPAPVGLTEPAQEDPLPAAGLQVRWAAGTGGSMAVIQMTSAFQGLNMGMPTGAVVRQMSVSCTVPDTGSFTLPAEVAAALLASPSDTPFQCGGDNNDACVSLTVRRENRVQMVVGQTDFTLVGSTASPTLQLTVPVMMEMP